MRENDANKYIIKRKQSNSKNIWDGVEALHVSNYPWDIVGYKPEMYAKMCYTEASISVLMYAYEKYPRATFHSINDPVCCDSCLEFFFQPCPENDGRYFNFEFNPWGVYLIGIGYDRYNLEFIDKEITDGRFAVKNKIQKVKRNNEDIYETSIEFSIPYDFITKYFNNFKPYPGTFIKGNFYKCGDDTIYPHYGCWNNITNDVPDFHRSECFGTLIFE